MRFNASAIVLNHFFQGLKATIVHIWGRLDNIAQSGDFKNTFFVKITGEQYIGQGIVIGIDDYRIFYRT